MAAYLQCVCILVRICDWRHVLTEFILHELIICSASVAQLELKMDSEIEVDRKVSHGDNSTALIPFLKAKWTVLRSVSFRAYGWLPHSNFSFRNERIIQWCQHFSELRFLEGKRTVELENVKIIKTEIEKNHLEFYLKSTEFYWRIGTLLLRKHNVQATHTYMHWKIERREQ